MQETVRAEVSQLYARLDQLRKEHGVSYVISLATREVFSHSPDLNLSAEDLKKGSLIFPEINEDFPESWQRHHPFLQMLNIVKRRWEEQQIRLLPGENYEILQSGDEEIVNVKQGITPPLYKVTSEQAEKFIFLFEVRPEKASQIRKLVNA